MTNPILSSSTDPYLTTAGAAQRLGVCLRTIQLWIDGGKLPAARTPGGHRRISVSDVQALHVAMGIKPARVAVLLTDEQIDAAFEASDGTRRSVGLMLQAAVFSANGLPLSATTGA